MRQITQRIPSHISPWVPSPGFRAALASLLLVRRMNLQRFEKGREKETNRERKREKEEAEDRPWDEDVRGRHFRFTARLA